MKITLPIKELNEVFQILGSVVPSRAVRPVLSYVYISADKEVKLTATDLEVGVEMVLEKAKIQEKGESLLPAGRLAAICSELKSGNIQIEIEGSEALVTSGKMEFSLPLESAEDYPEISFSAHPHGAVEAKEFSTMIKKTTFASATERSRFAINGVNVVLNNGQLDMTATDGRRLANISTKIKSKVDDFSVIVPSRSLSLVAKVVLTTGVDKIEIEVDENAIIFSLPNTRIMARLISGRFPDYNSVIPKKNKNKVSINKEMFEKIVRTAALVTSDESRSVLLKFSKNKLTTSAQTNLYGKSVVEEEIEYDDEAIEIRFNPGYLLDGLKVCDSKKIQFSIKDSHSPVLVEEDDDKKSSYKYVITPINVVS
jgi:DNA polymerase-3 subunit beta